MKTNLNLMPGNANQPCSTPAIVLWACLVSATAAWTYTHASFVKTGLAKTQQVLDAKEDEYRRFKAIKADTIETKKQIASYESIAVAASLAEDRKPMLTLFATVGKAQSVSGAPMYLTNLAVKKSSAPVIEQLNDGYSVTLNGVATTKRTVDEFVLELIRTERFRSVKLQSTTSEQLDKDRIVQSFRVFCKF